MSRDKQIEEMARAIYEQNNCYDTYWQSHCESLAEELYNAGYRKSTDVAEEIFAEIEQEIELALESNYKVKREYDDRDNYYTNELVTRMNGKIDALRGIYGFIAELKKKYTEEGK